MNRSCSGYSIFLRKLSDVTVVSTAPETGEDLLVVGLGAVDDERTRVGDRRELGFSIVFFFLHLILVFLVVEFVSSVS